MDGATEAGKIQGAQKSSQARSLTAAKKGDGRDRRI